MRDNLYNVDMKKILKHFEKKTIPGIYQFQIFSLIMEVINHKKGINLDDLADEEYDEFLKSSMPESYEEMQKEFQAFKDDFENFAAETGIKIVRKKDLDKYPSMYAVSLREALEGKELHTTDEMK